MKTEEITAILILPDHFMADHGQQYDLVIQCGASWDPDDKHRVYDIKLEVAVVLVNASSPSTLACTEGCI